MLGAYLRKENLPKGLTCASRKAQDARVTGEAQRIAEEWGNRIRTFRVGRGDAHRPQTSLEDLAAAIGVHATTVMRWERGEVVPRLEFMLALADYFCVPPATLFQLPTNRVYPATLRVPS